MLHSIIFISTLAPLICFSMVQRYPIIEYPPEALALAHSLIKKRTPTPTQQSIHELLATASDELRATHYNTTNTIYTLINDALAAFAFLALQERVHHPYGRKLVHEELAPQLLYACLSCSQEDENKTLGTLEKMYAAGFSLHTKFLMHSPLQTTYNAQRMRTFKWLLAQGETPNEPVAPVLIEAIKRNDEPTVRLLLYKYQADPNICCRVSQMRPLHQACLINSFSMVKLLVDSGSDVRALGPNGLSAIAIARTYASPAILHFLITPKEVKKRPYYAPQANPPSHKAPRLRDHNLRHPPS